jgi:deoxyribodipyrimidine photo-lyase
LEHKLASTENADKISPVSFNYLTVCHNTAVATFTAIHLKYKVSRILAHEETGHWQSYIRDRAVRKWCKANQVKFVEFNQTGVTRCLQNRDDYNKHWKAFMAKPRHPTLDLATLRKRIVQLDSLPGFLSQLDPKNDTQWSQVFIEIPLEHRSDRSGRQQFGGETRALETLDTFLQERGSRFSQDISSPNTAWKSCSRLSPYLAWGHVSLRYVLYALKERQETLRRMKAQGRSIGTWLKSLQAFSSRLHWRSHFIQKLESEPTMELRDLCPAYQPLRRQARDWNESYYRAWATGTTGFPFVDACMRCLMEHGWINFRMRAMMVSFACHNLWLDWKKIAPHLARVFLDFEPGIHYPQLQMQAGTTGINAMRVYNVTKQGKDQDPTGKFIRRYVQELERVPVQHIHEPWKMSYATKQRCKVFIGEPENIDNILQDGDNLYSFYPEPIVDEQESAKAAKAKLSTVRKQESTKAMANQVYLKHGSRNRRSDDMNGRTTGSNALLAVKESIRDVSQQPKISQVFGSAKRNGKAATPECKRPSSAENCESQSIKKQKIGVMKPTVKDSAKEMPDMIQADWSCKACTFLNVDKPHALVCGMCGTQR